MGNNPNNYTRDGAVHWQFENTFVDLIALKEGDIQARIPSAAQRVADPFTAVLQHIDKAHTLLERVYQLEARKAYADRSNQDARELVYLCTADAATLLRDLIYTAWVSSGDPVAAFSADDPTNSPKNPRYNPATGSAPSLPPR